MSPKARSEDQLSKEVARFFMRKLSASGLADQIEARPKQQVLMNLTVGRDPKRGDWRYYFGLQQQDIVFRLKGENGILPLLEGQRQYHSLSAGQKQIQVPLVICELKINRTFVTHHLITYSRIAEQIRQVHPHCAYYFVVGGIGNRRLKPETLLRQAKAFDRVYVDWEEEREIIWQDIANHLAYLRDRAGVIPNIE
ncbi:MAG: hypothetical protein E6I38_12325 [Chloroflexi bacterium]|nr:MAG: hypothetical protein E6I38_12325 [Chloroflexota bacterium]